MNLNLFCRPKTGPKAGVSRRRHHRGFTLVEMLLVITIIGILAALVVPKMMGRSEQARQSAARADIASIKTALDAYEVDNGSYPKALADLLQAPRQAQVGVAFRALAAGALGVDVQTRHVVHLQAEQVTYAMRKE